MVRLTTRDISAICQVLDEEVFQPLSADVQEVRGQRAEDRAVLLRTTARLDQIEEALHDLQEYVMVNRSMIVERLGSLVVTGFLLLPVIDYLT